MTVASETNQSGPYIGNGVTTVFDYEFRIVDETHISVILTEGGVDAVLILDTDYSVSGVGEVGGGTITMSVAPTASETIVIQRNMPFTQETDFENQGPYFAETVEAALDLAVMRDQQLSARLESVAGDVAAGLSSDVAVATAADRAAVAADRLVVAADRAAADASADEAATLAAALSTANLLNQTSDPLDLLVEVPTLDLTHEDIARVLTCQRASTATYFDKDGILKTAAANVARINYDPATLRPDGIIYESSSTNQCQRSQELDNAYWTKFNATISANAVAAPDNTVTADKVVEDTATSAHQITTSNIAVAKNVMCTWSVFLKAAERTKVRLLVNAFSGNQITADFDLVAGTVSAATNSGTASAAAGKITKLANGWYRCALSGVPSTEATSNIQCSVILGNGALFTSYLGDGASGVYAWGTQLESNAQCNYASSYIPTTSATVTRNSDNIRLIDSSYINLSEGTFYVDITPIGVQSGSGVEEIRLDDGAGTNSIRFRFGSVLAGCDLTVNSNSVSQVDSNSVAVVAGTRLRLAAGYILNNVVLASAGVALGADTVATMPLSLNRLWLGVGGGGAHKVHRVAYYPKRLSDAQLALMTKQ